LDAVGCALGGLSSDKDKIAVRLANRLSGPSEATIIGTGDRVSSYGAAFANGELIQALDYDGLTYPAIHVIPYVLAAPLALAEYRHASGKNLRGGGPRNRQ
jgi:2-methylcitrate dehydratase PrpD